MYKFLMKIDALMSIRISNDFIKGMNFTKNRSLKQTKLEERKNSVDESWKKLGDISMRS